MMKPTDPMAKRASDCSTPQSCMVDTPPPSKLSRTGPVCWNVTSLGSTSSKEEVSGFRYAQQLVQ